MATAQLLKLGAVTFVAVDCPSGTTTSVHSKEACLHTDVSALSKSAGYSQHSIYMGKAG